ncbi:hypothetical protein EMIHUDRAFT_194943 [Emiliania huxleyi CCMP1516]|uniref:CRAL-TRIO domain-containing protein n=3 Tax=Emiliania huxleyi TaxID=2903 RepID=A0A0D3L2E2_EMIH1|nr:hypothetical protein EMIHUDRAFT_194943 [Emiliania huxleyi CCMP1516]EOD42177.1 hypothetical protein EMIHUDRAFT_194943 [Emiliania huxleyi CCMP1516]|mmetsp:Transcript_6509/g.19282  ORF Transcript_6509/g.19282 Transcript_6509/m.19282 type:complete len:340 (-) Transcript_6509:229-1248(-)|eukprot:XP_005794606.1 hypothetical protein EMIHUDRAFT_194943 [Emiliania huxleyi CCMP1516]
MRRSRRSRTSAAESTSSSHLAESTSSAQGEAAPPSPDLVALLAAVNGDERLVESIERHRFGESAEALCARFARARAGSLPKALAMLRRDMERREERGFADLRAMSAAQVLSLSPSRDGSDGGALRDRLLGEWNPTGLLGRDYAGRPVLYRNFSRTRLWDVPLPLSALLKYNEWVSERLAASMGDVGKWTIVIDVANMGAVQCLHPTHLAFCKGLARTDAAHYPERLGRLLLINAPAVFEKFWNAFKAVLDPNTVAKIDILGSGPAVQRRLAELMPPEILPLALGGKATLSLAGLDPALPSLPPSAPVFDVVATRSSRGSGIACVAVYDCEEEPSPQAEE